MFDTDLYLARLRLPARPTTDSFGLVALQRAHRQAIPFETIDVALGRPIRIDSAGVYGKLVIGGRGGFCFEHNRLFGDALAAFGFDARPILARVWLGVTEPAPHAHVLSLVTIDGEAWIADAGFGGSYCPPMKLVDGAEETAADGARFRLERDGTFGWMLLRDGDPATTDGRDTGAGWRPQYSFTTDPVYDGDLAMGAHWAATAPSSPMRARVIVSIILPHGFATLRDGQYRRSVNADTTEAAIDDPRVYRLRLSMMFGIDLSADEVAALPFWAE